MQKSKTRRGAYRLARLCRAALCHRISGKQSGAGYQYPADNVDLDNAVANVVPTRGAIVRAEFKARVGIKLLMTLTHNNKPLPFGAMVTSESSQSSGIVADNGQVYLSGMPLAGKVQVKWGEEENAHCIANYQLPPESQQQLLTQLSAECR